MNLNELLALPKSGVVILSRGDSTLVSYTTSMGAELLQIYGQFAGQAGVSLRVVSSGVDLETLKLHTEYYRARYGAVGHSRKALQYKVRIVPYDRFKYVDVKLFTARGESKLVGRFKDTPEAKSFIETYYGASNPFNFPIYAVNPETRAIILDSRGVGLSLT